MNNEFILCADGLKFKDGKIRFKNIDFAESLNKTQTIKRVF